MADRNINKLNLETIDLLDKLIEPSEFMEEILKELLDLDFKPHEGNEDWKYNCPFWMINEDLKTYSPISFRTGECDVYNSLVTISSDVISGGGVDQIKIDYYLDMKERFIPNREDSAQSILLAYLKFHLVDNGSFKMFGPKTIIHYKTDDKILIYIRPDTMQIIHDGESVIDNFSIKWFNFHPCEVTDEMLNDYLQEVLHHF